jgi:hypothetical protein
MTTIGANNAKPVFGLLTIGKPPPDDAVADPRPNLEGLIALSASGQELTG